MSYFITFVHSNTHTHTHAVYPLLLRQALYQLYFDPDMERKTVAQKWLDRAQASAQAWRFCWPLLGPDKVCCCRAWLAGKKKKGPFVCFLVPPGCWYRWLVLQLQR